MTNKERDILIKHLENIILRAETAAEQQAPEMKYPYIAGALTGQITALIKELKRGDLRS